MKIVQRVVLGGYLNFGENKLYYFLDSLEICYNIF